MSKFVRSIKGVYVNVNSIISFYINSDNEDFEVIGYKAIRFYEDMSNDYDIEWCFHKAKTKSEAQEWLDTFMETHGLDLKPINQGKVFCEIKYD